MRAALRSLKTHQFFTLSFGVAVANAVSFLSMPLLARLYGSESFGIFAVYYSLANLIGIPSNLRLELAVPIADGEKDADNVSTLAAISAVCVSGVFAIGFLFAWPRSLFSTVPQGYTIWALTAVSIFVVGISQVFIQRCIRQGRLRTLSIRPVIERLGFVTFAFAAFRMHNTETGLIWAQMLAFVAAFICTLGAWWIPSVSFATIGKYLDFPKKNLPSTFLQLASSQIPMLVYARYFTATELGFLSLAQRLIDSPISLLSGSLLVVYYRRLLLADRGQFRRIFIRTVSLGALVLLPPCLIAGVFADPILNLLFGVKWAGSHPFFVVLLPLAFSKMLFTIHQSFFIVLRRLTAELHLSIALFGAQFIGILAGLALGLPLLFVSGLSAAVMAMVYLAGLLIIYRILNRNYNLGIN